MVRRRSSIHRIVRAHHPLTIEQLVNWWTKCNVGAFGEIALHSMMDPVGTAYEVPPLRVVGFQTGDARILYQISLHDMAKAQRRTPVAEHAIRRHTEDLAALCRAEFLTFLSRLDVTVTFQHDKFVREGR